MGDVSEIIFIHKFINKMKKSFWVLITVVAIAGCDVNKADKLAGEKAKEQMTAALKDSTRVQLIDSVFNFGTIAEGEKVEHNFRFKNIGSKPLVITEAHASCGCTVPEKPEKPILAGETGFMKVVFNSKGKQGHQEKAIMVSSNASPYFPDLKLEGEVKK